MLAEWQITRIRLLPGGKIEYQFTHRIRVDHPLGSVYTDSEVIPLVLDNPRPDWSICQWLTIEQVTAPESRKRGGKG